MRRLLTAAFALIFLVPAKGQVFKGDPSDNPLYWKNRKPDAAYWQQDIHCTIAARMDETDNRIDGKEMLEYFNNSPDTLREVFFHLYQNAFIKGSYLHQLEREKGQKARLGPHEAVGEGTIITEVNEQVAQSGGTQVFARAETQLDNTILRVTLLHPIVPGQSATLSVSFKTWYDNGSTRRRMQMYDAWGWKHYNGCQWFPKVCVYDRKFGWDTYQHLNKEFYGEFGTYDVSLDFPSNYILEATGALQNRSEVLPDELRQRLDVKNFRDKRWEEPPSVVIPYVKGERKEWKYHAEGVHDFAFTADPSYRIATAYWNGIECVGIVQEPHAAGWQNSAELVAQIVKTFSEDIGPYGYPKMVAADAQDGMEYPMLTLDGGSDPGYHGLLVHEIGHNWFYGMVGSNETYRAALDEGFTQFLTAWGLRRIDGENMLSGPASPRWTQHWAEPLNTLDRNVLNPYTADALMHHELPLNTHSNDFHDALGHEGGYRQVYYKTASMLYNLQYVLGDSLFQRAMQHYFAQWRFAHPYFEDFRASIIQFTHVDLNWFFDEWIETTKTIDYGIIGARRNKEQTDTWSIKFRRYGLSQMPVDFTVTSKNGNKQTYTIPNTWFSKQGTETLPKWWGWSRIQPTYTATVKVPGGLRSVQIDTSYRLADVNYTDNYLHRGGFGNGAGITRFDAGLSHSSDRRHYRLWYRPDLWWNAIDGLKAGMHMEGDYFGLIKKVDATIWFNSHLLREDIYKTAEGGKAWSRYLPVSYVLNLSGPFFRTVPQLSGELSFRDLDGLVYTRAGLRYATSERSSLSLFLLSFTRPEVQDADYLLFPTEWSSMGDRRNSSANLSWTTGYSYGRGWGSFAATARAPFLNGNRDDAFDYSFIEIESINTHRIGKVDLRTRVYLRGGEGTRLPYESLVFAGGANPELLMEDKYTRSVGFVPEGEAWQGMSRYEPVHFQEGGGLNLRGYSGYFMPDRREGEELIGYKSRSGAAVNAELDLDRGILWAPRLTRSWLHVSAYLFGDAGISEMSRYVVGQYTEITPTEMWSDIHADAGFGLAFTVKRFGPFAQARPLTLRFDFPLFLNRPPYGNPEYWALRYVIGVNRTF